MFRKVILWLSAIFIFYGSAVKSQDYKSALSSTGNLSFKDISKKNSSFKSYEVAFMLFPFNPILLIENKKFYVGITKEISLGFFPYGRAAFEYSLIFRETHLNQIRVSYNFDFPVETGDFAAFLLTVGGGYFTDFSKEGYFPQISFNLLIGASDNIGIDPYVKVRNTFMTDKNESDIFDFSFGLATVFYF